MQRREGLVVRIQIKDENGRVVGETDAVTMKGLLALAHEDGLRSVRTALVQVPTEENGKTAVVSSRVTTRRGTFTGIGDANPSNVNRRIAPHCIRMAETRATARALRLAVNIGEVAIEELADDFALARSERSDEERREPRERSENSTNGNGNARPERFRGRDAAPTEVEPGDRRAWSEAQKTLLFRLAYDLGDSREAARDRVLKALGVERFEWAERPQASRAIDALKAEVAARAASRTNGGATPSNGSSGPGEDIPF